MKKTVCKSAACCLVLAFLLGSGTGAFADRSAPAAENLELTTEVNTGVEGTLTARCDAGETLSFQITTKPRKGELRLLEDGRFSYVPRADKKGRDYFGYRAIDSGGGVSEEATVLIRIERAKRPGETGKKKAFFGF